jgi:hypothetical protein
MDVELFGTIYKIHWAFIAIFAYTVTFFLFRKFCKIFYGAATKAGKTQVSAILVAYSPMVLFLALPAGVGALLKNILGPSLWVMVLSVLTLFPYFIFLFWYCNPSKADIKGISN